jgi:uncharacterized membrane protein YbjE (DUF340 family)
MDTLFYLSKLIASLIIGVFFGKIISKKVSNILGKLQIINLYILLFFMGINTGAIEGVLTKLDTIGSQALLVAITNVVGASAVGLIASFLINRKKKLILDSEGKLNSDVINITSHDVNKLLGEKEINEEAKRLLKDHRIIRIFAVIREPLLLISIILLGVIAKLFTGAFEWFNQSVITYLLYALLFFTGVSIVNSELRIKEIFSSPWLLLLPVWTILGTYIGALLIPFVTEYTVKEAMGISSGFGWYSLSGIMITDLGHPMLGSISFLSNVFRESLTFFLVPLFSKFGMNYYYPAVCSGGATTMDVTLPILSSHFGSSTMVPSMYHGIVMTLLVPFLIPLFF